MTAFIVSCLQQHRGPGGPVPLRYCRGRWIDRRSLEADLQRRQPRGACGVCPGRETGSPRRRLGESALTPGRHPGVGLAAPAATTDRRYPLEPMVEEHGNAESGQNLGNVVVVVASLCDRDRSSTRANSPLRPIGWPLSRAQHLSGAPTPYLPPRGVCGRRPFPARLRARWRSQSA